MSEELRHRLRKAIPGLEIDYFDGACPVQGDGTYRGQAWYFRFRHDDAQLYLWANDGKSNRFEHCELYAERESVTGEDLAGVLTDDEAVALFVDLWGSLRPYAEYDEGTRVDRLTRELERLGRLLNQQKRT